MTPEARGYLDKIKKKDAEIDATVKLLMLFKKDLREKDAEIDRLNQLVAKLHAAARKSTPIG